MNRRAFPMIPPENRRRVAAGMLHACKCDLRLGKTGLSEAEIAALRWEDIFDFAPEELHHVEASGDHIVGGDLLVLESGRIVDRLALEERLLQGQLRPS